MTTPDSTLAAVSARVLEELCFHWVDPDSSAHTGGIELACASVGFSGPWSGRMVVAIDKGLLSELAANLLGADETSEGDSTQALLELANVMCGNALPELDSVTSAFELSSPEIIDASSAQAAGSVVASAALDGGKIMIRLLRDPAS